ncbi:MAG TPA: ABC transporter permease [Candidatus Acidoferrales bacterium]|nr:ABC transporter permease [Candidatus Acidoferrales bacterium]
MNPFRYILRRLIFGIVVLVAVMTMTFVLSRSLGGNTVMAWLGKSASIHPELAVLYAQKYHLNDPIPVQYYYYVLNLLQGNLGFSPSRGFQPVVEVIGMTLPFTLQITFFAFVISLILGVALGVLSAQYHHKPLDKCIRGFYLAGYSSPPFFVALILLIAFAFIFHLLPSGGAVDISLNAPSSITGIPMIDALVEGNFPYLLSSLQHVILPSLALALVTFGVLTRVLRSSLLDVMHANYIRTARAKGLDESTVFFKHALRNAMISVVTISSLMVTWLITGTIFVENVFAYPGMGQYLVTALAAEDYPGILGVTIVFAVFIVITNLIADVLYAVVDPQVRLG